MVSLYSGIGIPGPNRILFSSLPSLNHIGRSCQFLPRIATYYTATALRYGYVYSPGLPAFPACHRLSSGPTLLPRLRIPCRSATFASLWFRFFGWAFCSSPLYSIVIVIFTGTKKTFEATLRHFSVVCYQMSPCFNQLHF